MGGICPAQERSPRRRHPDTAHKRKDLPRAGTLPSAKTSRHGARAKGFAPRRNTLLGEGLPTRRTSERICPAQKRSPRRRPPDTAHERKDLPHAGTRPSAKASRHGAKAKGFAPRRNALLDEGLPTRHTSERICPAQKHSPRRRPPDTAHGRKDLPRAETRPTAKAYRHGARAKGFAPRRNALLGEGLSTRRTSERICPAQKRSPRRRPPERRTSERICPTRERSPRRKSPDTAHERKGLPHAQKRSPRRRPPDTAHERKGLPRRGSRSPHMPTNGGPLPTDGQPEKHPFGGVAPETARPLPSSFTLKKDYSMKSNCSTANRTSVRVKSSSRSLRSAAASRRSETLCRPSLPTAEAGTAACAATAKCATASAKWCADSANAPAAVNHSPAAAMHGPSVAADMARASAASANASTGAAVQTPTPAAADAAPAAITTSGNGPSAAPARPSATDGAAAKKTSASAGALTAERRAAAVAAGVVLRSADDRTALFTQWLAPHLPMVRGLVRRHTYFAGERADDYQTAVLHLLEHLDDLAHFALCLTARRDTAKPHVATANRPAPARAARSPRHRSRAISTKHALRSTNRRFI